MEKIPTLITRVGIFFLPKEKDNGKTKDLKWNAF